MEIFFRAVVEVLGKPKEHVEKSIRAYLKKLGEDKNYVLLRQELAESRQQPGQELWAVFAEVEVKTASLDKISHFCFEYMPSLIEIIKPKELVFKDNEVSLFLNDLQSKLHQVDMVAKQLKLENDIFKKSIHDLLGNYVVFLLRKNNLTSAQLSQMTGMVQDKLEDFLDILIDEGKIDLKEGIYFLKGSKV